ncbi:MAG TPA: S41 family peptidase [Steroidobacteraceae bacterium]|nr:S41 family peptidase [Steroidobacteraceae bacterium]
MSAKMPPGARPLMRLLIGLSLGLGCFVVSADAPPAPPGQDLPWQDARLLAEVLEHVEREYVEPVDDHQLLQAAIRGMVSSLDPYSAYLDSDEYDEIKISSSGQYSGVGIEVSMEDGQVVVVAPLDGSPAAEAGIRPGDVISTIDGVAVNTTTLADTIGRMRGKEGTSVKIGILREGSTEPLTFTLKRSRVQLHSVKAELPEAGFGYVRIAQFSETTGEELTRALKELRKDNGAPLKGLVLDLRNNPGGVLEAAVAVADAFLDSGVIVSAKGRTQESKFEMSATPGDELNGAPIVVLVNGGSASAAEIVAGALKDHHRATLIGRTTFGKGSVQTVMPLGKDRAIKLTTSLYYTPSGVSINHRGITPDIEFDQDSPPSPAPPAGAPLIERDPEVKRAIQELKVSGHGAVSAAVRN